MMELKGEYEMVPMEVAHEERITALEERVVDLEKRLVSLQVWIDFLDEMRGRDVERLERMIQNGYDEH